MSKKSKRDAKKPKTEKPDHEYFCVHQDIYRRMFFVALDYHDLKDTVRDLIADVKKRHPGEELKCSRMKQLDYLVNHAKPLSSIPDLSCD